MAGLSLDPAETFDTRVPLPDEGEYKAFNMIPPDKKVTIKATIIQ
jgi:hypothetical protein